MTLQTIRFDRDQWQWKSRTKYADGTLRPFKMDKVVIHWGGYTNPGDGEADEAAVLRGWQRYHMDSKGWTDVAYNFPIGNSGLTYRARGMNRSGATSGDFDDDGIPENYEALAFVWIGGRNKNTGASYPISQAAYDAMGRGINDAFEVAGTELPVTIHKDHKSTACPGELWEAWRDAQGWVGDGTEPPPVDLPPEQGAYDMRTVRNGDGTNAKPDPTVASAQGGMTIHGFIDRNSIAENGADGIFRSGTETQTKNFQQAKGLVIDGAVGPATWAEIDRKLT